MSGQLGELVVSISADLARFREDMGRANRTAQDTMNRMQADVSGGIGRIERSFSNLGTSVGSALSVTALITFGKECTNAALAAEKLNMQFKASTGSAAVAGQELAYIKRLSAELGLEVKGTAEAYSKFLASTRDTSIEGDKTRKVFEGVSEASTALGLSADETKGIFLALTQMMSKGKVQAEELTGQLGERLPGALKLAATGMGMTTAELLKQMQEGKVMSSELLPKLAAELHKTYGTAATEAAKQGRAGIALFKNEVFETAAAIGSHLLPAVNSFARSLADALKTMREQPSGGWTNLFQGFMSGDAAYNDAWLRETFRLPGRDTATTDRDTRVANRLSAQRAASGSYDPQMSRAMADRRARQEEENAARAAKERWEAGRAEREKAAKEAETAAEQQRQAYNQGVQGYNRLVDAFTSSRPDLSETQKALAKINDEIAALSREHPEQAKDAQIIGLKIKAQLELADARKVENAQLKESIRLLEDLNKDVDGFGGYAQGLGMDALKLPTIGGRRGKDGSMSGGMPRFSLTGPAATTGFGGNPTNPAIAMAQKDADERLAIEKQFNNQMMAMKIDAADQALGIAKNAAGDNKAVQLAILAAETGIAIARIMMAEGVALMNAKASTAILGPAGEALFAVQAAEISGMAGMSIGLAVAGGAMQAIQIAGQRANGGPIQAGKDYLVGERGPEVIHAYADGYVTPNHALGGTTYAPVYNIDARNSRLSEQEFKAVVEAANNRSKAEILSSMNRAGTFAVASGRIRG